ncbi:putative glycoside hydrolase family 5 protein [Neofusicoccum parvum]|uniref:Glycoside hydrolase family 5 protein n=1 Tax=Neofusicoccum parvum TaxID=310453 RepID=A0ACB5RUB6_9PEZI|nr:putative glycoside hydrolase family 5 protein [Neofusicoccum parvum]GME49966.1 putative glycoside hydrolase family 5 protein [Neofusicoccum parvum]
MRVSTVLLAGTASLALAAPVQKEEKRASKFEFFGVNESGPEFGEGNLPGTLNTDYVWPTLSTIDTFVNKGMNTIRVNILMERLTQGSMTASLDATYLADLKKTVNYITNLGAYAMIVPHNYGRFSGSIITDTAGFKTWWKNVATEFASNEKVIFDINNEFHDMDQTLVVNLNQAGIDGIRAAGATSQYITAEGNSWTGAWSWVSSGNGDTMGNLTDPQDKLYYQMHQYLDSDSSGTSETCVSSTIGQERLEAATTWLKNNGKKAILGEYAGGNNDQCKTAVKGMLSYMQENSDVWAGALWWAAGPWWGTYLYSMEPTDGIAYTNYLDVIAAYA